MLPTRTTWAICCAVAIVAGVCLLADVAAAGFDLWVDPTAVPPIMFQTLNASSYPCAVAESCLSLGNNRRVMRFGNSIVNLGNADLTIGTPPPDGQSDAIFHWDTCHGHHHVKQIMRYELLDGTGVVAIGRKQNFCMADTRPYVANPPPAAHDCHTVQGLTHGWADLYDPDLDCQWLDVTGLPNGQYTLRLTVDPTNAYAEDNENNNVTTRLVVLQNPVGYEVDQTAQLPTMRIINARPEWGAEAIHFATGKESGRVTLSVFDIRGAERRTLLDQEEEAGASEYVQWRGTDQSGNVLPSGIYYVRLKLPAGSMTRPVLILSRRN